MAKLFDDGGWAAFGVLIFFFVFCFGWSIPIILLMALWVDFSFTSINYIANWPIW